jgi:hypothetical protein
MLVEDVSRNKCFFQVPISYIIVISIRDIFINFYSLFLVYLTILTVGQIVELKGMAMDNEAERMWKRVLVTSFDAHTKQEFVWTD